MNAHIVKVHVLPNTIQIVIQELLFAMIPKILQWG